MKYQAMWKESIEATNDIICAQDMFLIKLGSMKNDNADIIKKLSQNAAFFERPKVNGVLSEPPHILEIMKIMKLHAAFRGCQVVSKSFLKYIHPFEKVWRSIFHQEKSHTMRTAYQISSLRESKNTSTDILQKAAVEQIFLSSLRDGEVSEDHQKLLNDVKKMNKRKFKGDTEDIEYMAKAFAIQQINPQVFSEQKRQWIQDIYQYTIDTEIDYLLDSFDRRSLIRNIEQTNDGLSRISQGLQTTKTIDDNIKKLDHIIMILYMHRSLSVDDCEFIFENVDKKFWEEGLEDETMIRNHEYKEMSKKLLGRWGKSMIPIYNPQGTREVGHVEATKESLEARYSVNPSLFEIDSTAYQNSIKRLIKVMESMNKAFDEGSMKFLDELSEVYDWYSKRALISFSKV